MKVPSDKVITAWFKLPIVRFFAVFFGVLFVAMMIYQPLWVEHIGSALLTLLTLVGAGIAMVHGITPSFNAALVLGAILMMFWMHRQNRRDRGRDSIDLKAARDELVEVRNELHEVVLDHAICLDNTDAANDALMLFGIEEELTPARKREIFMSVVEARKASARRHRPEEYRERGPQQPGAERRRFEDRLTADDDGPLGGG